MPGTQVEVRPDAQVAANPATSMDGKAGKYLTFRLATEEYGLEILKVQEIIGIMEVTRIPKTPAFVRGVINLRGKVIPVVDLRLKFGMERKEQTERTCIVVVQVLFNDERATMGILVDEVSEVMDIAADQLENTPSLGTNISTDFLLGIGKIGQKKVVMLLDVDKVLSSTELEIMEGVSQQCPMSSKASASANEAEGNEAEGNKSVNEDVKEDVKESANV